jgi:hypothetical protein
MSMTSRSRRLNNEQHRRPSLVCRQLPVPSLADGAEQLVSVATNARLMATGKFRGSRSPILVLASWSRYIGIGHGDFHWASSLLVHVLRSVQVICGRHDGLRQGRHGGVMDKTLSGSEYVAHCLPPHHFPSFSAGKQLARTGHRGGREVGATSCGSSQQIVGVNVVTANDPRLRVSGQLAPSPRGCWLHVE